VKSKQGSKIYYSRDISLLHQQNKDLAKEILDLSIQMDIISKKLIPPGR
jgi:hypothetical protein